MNDQDSEKLENVNVPIGPATDYLKSFKKEEGGEIHLEDADADSFDDSERINEDSHSEDKVVFPLLETENNGIESEATNSAAYSESSAPSGSIASSDSVVENAEAITGNKSFFKSVFGRILFYISLIGIVLLCVFVFPSGLQKTAVSISLFTNNMFSKSNDKDMADDKAILESSIAKLDRQLDSYVPAIGYIIINSTDNEFTLMKGRDLIRRGKCSTGSYVILEDDKNNKKWLFKTPKGVRKILSKKTDPVWTKPDWAFKEEGLPVPSPNDPSRFEEGVLGDYALSMGNGYMIHGTIWQRYLGLPVTHGCVRLNDDDLKAVYNGLQKGSNVYIY